MHMKSGGGPRRHEDDEFLLVQEVFRQNCVSFHLFFMLTPLDFKPKTWKNKNKKISSSPLAKREEKKKTVSLEVKWSKKKSLRS